MAGFSHYFVYICQGCVGDVEQMRERRHLPTARSAVFPTIQYNDNIDNHCEADLPIYKSTISTIRHVFLSFLVQKVSKQGIQAFHYGSRGKKHRQFLKGLHSFFIST